MCSFADRVTKLCQVAGQAEYELMKTLAPLWCYRETNGSISQLELAQARKCVTLRGDAWAASAFNRVIQFLQDNPEVCEQLAKGQIDGEPHQRETAIQAYLRKVEPVSYPEELICEEVADLVHTLEGA